MRASGLLFLLGFIYFFSSPITAAPERKLFIETGYSFLLSEKNVPYPDSNRLAWLAGYGYKLREGERGKHTDLFITLGTEHAVTSNVLVYGLEILHFLKTSSRLQPWLGYGLIFSQISEKSFGTEAGHYTKLIAGIALNQKEGGHKWTVSLSYVISTYPSFSRDAMSLNFLNLSIGRYFSL